MIRKIFKTISSLFVLVAVLLSSILVFSAVDSARPTLTLYLGEYEIQKVDGKNYITVPVYVSDNTADLFVINYRVISKDKLTPVFFDDGDFCEKNIAGTSVTVKLNSSYTNNPDGIIKVGYTGIQVLQDSSNGTRGISTKSGLLGTAWFEVSDTSVKYEFSIENLGGNNVYTDNSGKKQIGTYTVSIPKDDAFSQTEQVPDTSSSDASSGEISEPENSIQNTQSLDSSQNPESHTDGISKQPQKSDGEADNWVEYSKYIVAVIGALVITAIIICIVIILNKKTKGAD